jgi:hypothetical protein
MGSLYLRTIRADRGREKGSRGSSNQTEAYQISNMLRKKPLYYVGR